MLLLVRPQTYFAPVTNSRVDQTGEKNNQEMQTCNWKSFSGETVQFNTFKDRCLPKIHNVGNEMIIAATNSPTQKTSEIAGIKTTR